MDGAAHFGYKIRTETIESNIVRNSRGVFIMNAFMNSILRVDLFTGSITKEQIPEHWMRKYFGVHDVMALISVHDVLALNT